MRNVLRFFAITTLLLKGAAVAATLKPETVQAWNEYVHAASVKMEARLHSGSPFLSIDEDEGRTAAVRGGEAYIAPGNPQNPRKVPSGLIHDWFGAEFIPGANLAQVISTVRDYGRYKDYYCPSVIGSETLATNGRKDRFSIVLMNNALVSKTALDSDYESSYIRVDDRRWYSVSQTTRTQEVENYGTPDQRLLPEDEGTGLIWRLFSIMRFEERAGGVYIEVEAIALSRDVPVSLRWVVMPIVRRVSRNSLATSLQQTGNAVRSSTSLAARPAALPSAQGGAMLSSFR